MITHRTNLTYQEAMEASYKGMCVARKAKTFDGYITRPPNKKNRKRVLPLNQKYIVDYEPQEEDKYAKDWYILD